MHSCCNQPIETIAADKHKVDDACCLVTETSPAPARANCPVSHTLSRKVQHRTVEHLVKPERRSEIQNAQYYYCTDPNCSVVYFSDETVPFFSKDDILVKVFVKDKGDDVNVCYCFDWSRGRIKQQIGETGKSTASTEIAREVQAGRCMCDIKNPKGECCLGDINMTLKEALRS